MERLRVSIPRFLPMGSKSKFLVYDSPCVNCAIYPSLSGSRLRAFFTAMQDRHPYPLPINNGIIPARALTPASICTKSAPTEMILYNS